LRGAAIESALVTLEGKRLCEGLWWCAFLRQSPITETAIDPSSQLLEEFLTRAQGVDTGIFNKMKAYLNDNYTNVDGFFQEIQRLLERTQEEKKRLEGEQERVAAQPNLNNRVNNREAINTLTSALMPLEFEVLKTYMNHTESQMETIIKEHDTFIDQNAQTFFPDLEIRATVLNGLEYTKEHLPKTYHVALINALEREEKDRPLAYVSNELKKIFNHIELQEALKASKNRQDTSNIEEIQKLEKEVLEQSFFSDAFKGPEAVKNFLDCFEIKPEDANKPILPYAEKILELPAFGGKMQKVFANKIYQKISLNTEASRKDPHSLIHAIGRFYQDAVMAGSGHSADKNRFPNARCTDGLMTDAKQVMAIKSKISIPNNVVGNIACNI
jgi:hypothetical protein